MSYYTKGESERFIVEAWVIATKHEGYRFGQALWNIMDNFICEGYAATEADFFYEKDPDVVLSKFYKYFVVGGL